MKTLTQSKTLIELIKITKDWKKKPCTHQFNLIDELHANENAHTRILVRLLQIPSLLRSFLEYIRDTFQLQSFYIPDELSANDVSEFSDFIDAKIETKNFCIIIENKINYAVDQDRQIERYVSTVKSQNKNIFVLYLTLNGTKIPTPNSIGKSAVPIIEINYREHILNWLEHKITFSVSDTLQQPFLQSGILQYIDHIKGRLGMRKNDRKTLLNDIENCLAEADIFDVIIGILSGSFIGASFIDESNDIIYKIAAIIFIIAFLCLKIYVLTTRKWSFYDKLFEHLKNDIE